MALDRVVDRHDRLHGAPRREALKRPREASSRAGLCDWSRSVSGRHIADQRAQADHEDRASHCHGSQLQKSDPPGSEKTHWSADDAEHDDRRPEGYENQGGHGEVLL
jgi:hypothetical protein